MIRCGVAKKRFRDEYLDADLSDLRRQERLAELGMALAAFPDASLPVALRTGAALEAGYRFLSNDAVTDEDILGPHQRETAARCAERSAIVVAHDTTDYTFPGTTRRGLGRIRNDREQGFLSQMALAIDPRRAREPLGVVHLENWVRGEKASGSSRQRQRAGDPTRESTRWLRGVENAADLLGAGVAIHVMDREGDMYELLVALVAKGERFVIRAQTDRNTTEDATVSEVLAAAPVSITREVPLSARRAGPTRTRRTHPPRTARDAKLTIKAAAVAIARPQKFPVEAPPSLAVHVVVVEETAPPDGEPAVGWVLYTTEPIATPGDVERVVDAYRCRWRIEEMFKVLKTGCAIEKRQLESGHALTNLLAVMVPIAWRLLRHRTLAHDASDEPASSVLTPLQLRILRKEVPKLPRSPSAQDALMAVASIGGHLKHNGPPGWITLWRGYARLLTLEEGVALAERL